MGFVTSRGFGFAVGEVLVLGALSVDARAWAIDAAVGAVRELRLAFLTGALWVDKLGESWLDEDPFAEIGVFG